MDARFKISVPGKDRRCHEIEFGDRFFDIRMERTGISDTRGAAVADKIESELIEIFLQPGLVEIIRDHARARCERRFHRWIDPQSAFHRFFREQSCSEHHAWVARVRATGNGGDQNSAVSNLALPMLKRIGSRVF